MQDEGIDRSLNQRTQPFVIGAWHIQVTFSTDHPDLPTQVRGQTQNAVLLFMPGGVLSVSGPITDTSGGAWKQIDAYKYSIFLSEFAFEPGLPPGRLARIIVHKDAVLKLADNGNSFTMMNATVKVAIYDPATGKRTFQQETDYSHDEANPIERIKGWRINEGWQVPDFVPAQPVGN